MFSWDISTYKVQGSISLCGQVLDICIPIKVMTDFRPKLLSMIYCLKNLAMQNMLVPN